MRPIRSIPLLAGRYGAWSMSATSAWRAGSRLTDTAFAPGAGSRQEAGRQHPMGRRLIQPMSLMLCLGISLSAVPSNGADAASDSFALRGGGSVAIGGKSAAADSALAGSGGGAEPIGVAEAGLYRLRSGTQIPDLVEQILRFTLAAGWNLRGSPVATDETLAEIFAGTLGYPLYTGEVYLWDGADYATLAEDDRLPANSGFWVFSYWGGAGQPFRGADGSRATLLAQMTPGWNLYSPSYHISLPAEILWVWHWDAQAQQYKQVPPEAVLVPLQAYWIYFDEG